MKDIKIMGSSYTIVSKNYPKAVPVPEDFVKCSCTGTFEINQAFNKKGQSRGVYCNCLACGEYFVAGSLEELTKCMPMAQKKRKEYFVKKLQESSRDKAIILIASGQYESICKECNVSDILGLDICKELGVKITLEGVTISQAKNEAAKLHKFEDWDDFLTVAVTFNEVFSDLADKVINEAINYYHKNAK